MFALQSSNKVWILAHESQHELAAEIAEFANRHESHERVCGREKETAEPAEA